MNAFTKQVHENLLSNLSLLLRGLQDLGYTTPYGILNPTPRVEANRRRAWLPCYYWPHLDAED